MTMFLILIFQTSSILFMTPLTPKSKEIVAYSHQKGGFEAGKRYFEDMFKKALKEISRVLKPNGIAIIVYTHKSTSSIYFVCRKMERKQIGWLNEVKEEIKNYIPEKLKSLWEEGISGADYFVSAIGSAVEIFGKYRKIMDYEGNEIDAVKLLDYVREVVTEHTLRQILHSRSSGELSPMTRFYLLWLWRWTYGEAKVHFDEARKLAQSSGIEIVLGPQDRRLDDIKSDEMIDVLHKSVLLWKKGRTK